MGHGIRTVIIEQAHISQADRPAAFAALYNAARGPGIGSMGENPAVITEGRAAEILARETWFSVFEGRCLQLDFAADPVSLRGYDMENGEGAGIAALDAAGIDWKEVAAPKEGQADDS